MNCAFGIHEGAFHVGRTELLNFVNELLQTNYTKVEQFASGAPHCAILDAVFPGKVPLQKVKFDAKHPYEFEKNFKVLQAAFDKLNISKHIPIDLLMKGKYQDNLEFLQWMVRFYKMHAAENPEYDPIARRSGAKTGFEPTTKSSPKATAPAKAPAKVTPPTKAPTARKAATRSSASPKTSTKEVQDLKARVAELEEAYEASKSEAEFYLGKCRDVEILCQTHENPENTIIKSILEILYKVDDDGEFVAVEEDGMTAE
eukprot:TRINITY_DN41868_c0_g1_i1.p1 TRINITY_DN41868_c0_g1~~TRINITY_DN41868_c0_g1_i1.p1  ORF type:complete len:258 (+),score=92.71 TRINITY_DN41868_c0_g1_i1:67-840(+)